MVCNPGCLPGQNEKKPAAVQERPHPRVPPGGPVL